MRPNRLMPPVLPFALSAATALVIKTCSNARRHTQKSTKGDGGTRERDAKGNQADRPKSVPPHPVSPDPDPQRPGEGEGGVGATTAAVSLTQNPKTPAPRSTSSGTSGHIGSAEVLHRLARPRKKTHQNTRTRTTNFV